jgi:ribosomal RNA-processing protein 7
VATAGMERLVAGQQDDGDAQGDGSGRRKKKKAKDMTDFYHFQQHERKREGLMKLREQFELDKQRIAKMRADRSFKPAGYSVQL